MAYEIEVGTSAVPTSGGLQTINHGSFTGKAVIIWGASKVNSVLRGTWGFATSSTNRVAHGAYSEDNAGTSDCLASRSEGHVVYLDGPAAADEGFADLDSFNSGNFKLDWTAPGANVQGASFDWMVLGGSALLEASVAKHTAPSSTGITNHTDSNFTGGAPDIALYLAGNFFSADGSPVSRANIGHSFNVATGTDNEWSVAFGCRDGLATTNTWKGNRVDKCIGIIDDTSKAWKYQGEHSAFTYVGGVGGHDINWTSVTADLNIFDSLFLRGGLYKAFYHAEEDSTGLHDVRTVGFRGKGVLICGSDGAENTLEDHVRNTMGGADEGNRTNRVMWWGDEDAVTTSNALNREDDELYRTHDANAGIKARVDLAHFLNDGFTSNYRDAGASPNEFMYVVLGGESGGPQIDCCCCGPRMSLMDNVGGM